MTTESNTNKFKILIGILTALLIALAIYTFNLRSTTQEMVGNLQEQKADIEQELEGFSY